MKDDLIYCIVYPTVDFWKIYCVDRLAVCTFSRPNPCPRICKIFSTLPLREQSWSLLAQVNTWLAFKGTLAQDFSKSLPFRNIPGLSLAHVHCTWSILKRLFARLYNKTVQHFCTVLTESNSWDDFLVPIRPERWSWLPPFDRNLCWNWWFNITHTLKKRKTQLMRSKPSPETLPYFILFSHTAEFNDRGEATDILGGIPGSGHAHHLEMGYWGTVTEKRKAKRGDGEALTENWRWKLSVFSLHKYEEHYE